MTEEFTAEEVCDALDFLIKHPTPFSFEDIEDMDKKHELMDRFIDARNIHSWFQIPANRRRTLKGDK